MQNRVFFYVTRYKLSINKITENVQLNLVNELSTQMIHHNIGAFRHLINYKCSNDVITNDDCSTLVRLEGAVSLLKCLDELRYICGIKENVYNELVIFIFKKCGLYRIIADDIISNIFMRR